MVRRYNFIPLTKYKTEGYNKPLQLFAEKSQFSIKKSNKQIRSFNANLFLFWSA